MRHQLLPFVLAAAVFLPLENASAQEQASATVVVTVPDGARLYFDKDRTEQTGTKRTFATPPLNFGTAYEYTLKVELSRDGKEWTKTRKIIVRAGETTHVDFSDLGSEPRPTEATPAAAPPVDASWPRKIVHNDETFTVYPAQVEKWEQNRLEARAIVSVETKDSPLPVFGLLRIRAHTVVDRGQVALEDLEVPQAEFPTAPEKSKKYLEVLRMKLPEGTRSFALDDLEANLAVTQARASTRTAAVKNEPPEILVSTKPALLVLIDGKPVLREVGAGKLQRIINTRALILFDEASNKYYLRLADRWLEAPALAGPWSASPKPPETLETALGALRDSPQVDLPEAEAFEKDTIPVVYVRTAQAELIQTQGEPELAPIEGTRLQWVKNTTSQVLRDLAGQAYFVLLSGRWFRAKALQGPWEFVPADKLPGDFAKIPPTHPRGDVLASVAGTPQAREAVLANQAPQTTAVRRNRVGQGPIYDGPPQFKPIEGTALQYAVNSPTPVIRIDAQTYYAVENGVWFTASSPNGPWFVATSVPAVIYTIPPSSPLYYVTGVYVYGSTPYEVYMGYTPEYFGTVVCPENVVVYGTGYAYPEWIGSCWFGRPWTFGWGTRFGRWPRHGFFFASRFHRPWWGPIGWHLGWGGAWWRPAWRAGSFVHPLHFVREGAGTRIVGPELPRGGTGHHAAEGWEMHTGNSWRHFDRGAVPLERHMGLENVWADRRSGATFFRSTGRVGSMSGFSVRPMQPGVSSGFHSGSSGFRSSSFHPSFGGFRSSGFHGGFHSGGHGGGGHGHR
jgi:uncharacterized protein (TIGR03000 family)